MDGDFDPSHTFIVRSLPVLTVASRFPSGLQATLRAARSQSALPCPSGAEGNRSRFISGATLDTVLAAAGTALPAQRVLEILEQAAGALDFAHSHGVVHRDVKPSNIMVQRDGKVKLTDFGIARRATATSVTLPGGIAGSPYYMPPEQLRGQDAGPRSDRCSLAVVAWILLTGSKPFDEEEMVSLISKILGQEPPPSNQLGQAADAVLRRALAKDGGMRFESCTAFVSALREAYSSGTTLAAAPAIRHDRPSKRGRIVVAAFLAMCLLAGAGVAWMFRTSASTSPREDQKGGATAPVTAAIPAATIESPAKSDPPVRVATPAGKTTEKPAAHPNTTGEKKLGATAPPASHKPGETRANSANGLTYVWIPAGSFSMGCTPGDNDCADDEKPAHPVTISKGFWMGQTEVTEEAYRRIKGGEGFPRRSKRPVTATWEEARDYCEAVGMRLPTEAEWEYAARAGSTGSRYGELDLIAWYDGNSGLQTHDVASKKANAWDLYDVLGNVWEWTTDWYGRYAPEAATDPQGPAEGSFRIRRGGGSRVGPKMARASHRVKRGQDTHYSAGFRCAGN